MNFPRIRLLIVGFASLIPSVYAVEELPEKEEDIPVEFVPTLNTAVSIGMHHVSGPKVRFKNLGHVPIVSPDVDSDHPATRKYSNGSVTQDSANTYEVDKDGNLRTADGSTRYTTGWISVVSVNGSDRMVTVYTPVKTAVIDPSTNKPYTNYQGSYVRATTPVVSTDANGSTTVTDGDDLTWASTSRYLGYDASRARTWSVANASQIDPTNHTVTMDAYGTSSEGESRQASSGGSTGVEVAIERTLGKRGRWEWGISAGLQLTQINASTTSTVWSHLTDSQDVYSMVATPYNGAMYNSGSASTIAASAGQTLALVNLSNGAQVYQYVDPLTAPLTGTSSGDQSQGVPLNVDTMNRTVYDGGSEAGHGAYKGEALVHGYWQIKGSYYLLNVGPTVRYRFNNRWAISGKLALSVAYIGTNFRADEEFNDYSDIYFYNSAGLLNPTPTALVATEEDKNIYRTQVQQKTHKFLTGFYGEVNAEYWVTERTGFYAGISFQSLSSYKPTPLDGRSADVDLGGGGGWRLGIITRF